MDKVMEIIQRHADRKFWGEVILVYADGKVWQIKEHRSIKLMDHPYKKRHEDE